MTNPSPAYSDLDAAKALISVVGESRWEAVALAHAWLALAEGGSEDGAARVARERGVPSLKEGRELLSRARAEGFLAVLKPRKKVGSAENPVTKLFPAAVTEERFLELAGDLCERCPGLSCQDERETGHSGSSGFSVGDFSVHPGSVRASSGPGYVSPFPPAST